MNKELRKKDWEIIKVKIELKIILGVLEEVLDWEVGN